MSEVLNNEVNPNAEDNAGGNDGKLVFTQEELDALLQREGDKRVTSALKKQEQKNAEKLKEAEKLAKMNEEQKYAYELEQREAAIAEKEKALALAENKNEASKILAEKGISLSLVDFVVAEDAETMNDNIQLLDKAFKQSVKEEVERRLASKTPTKSLPMDKTITKEQFSKLGYQELMQLKNEQPELYNEFVK